jgi:hypothetical protein
MTLKQIGLSLLMTSKEIPMDRRWREECGRKLM